jgi:hypothetical protein
MPVSSRWGLVRAADLPGPWRLVGGFAASCCYQDPNGVVASPLSFQRQQRRIHVVAARPAYLFLAVISGDRRWLSAGLLVSHFLLLSGGAERVSALTLLAVIRAGLRSSARPLLAVIRAGARRPGWPLLAVISRRGAPYPHPQRFLLLSADGRVVPAPPRFLLLSATGASYPRTPTLLAVIRIAERPQTRFPARRNCASHDRDRLPRQIDG